MVTWEEAKRCPKCGEPGNEMSVIPIRTGRSRGGKQHTLHCENERCKWFQTGWTVTVGPNGEIPDHTKGPKSYPDLGPSVDAMARRYLERIAQEDPAMAADLRRLENESN